MLFMPAWLWFGKYWLMYTIKQGLRYEDHVSYLNYLRMHTKRRQRNGSSVNAQCTRSARAMTTRCTQWKREIAMRTPWHRHLQEKRQNSMRYHGALGKLRTPCSRSGNAARCHRSFTRTYMLMENSNMNNWSTDLILNEYIICTNDF